MLVDQENIIPQQPFSQKERDAQCQMKPLAKRKPLSPLNDVSILNDHIRKQPLSSSPLQVTQIPQVAKKTNSHSNIVAEKTPKSTLCDVRKLVFCVHLSTFLYSYIQTRELDIFCSVNSAVGSSTNAEKTVMKKSFQEIPQTLSFDEPTVHANSLHNSEKAGMCLYFILSCL